MSANDNADKCILDTAKDIKDLAEAIQQPDIKLSDAGIVELAPEAIDRAIQQDLCQILEMAIGSLQAVGEAIESKAVAALIQDLRKAKEYQEQRILMQAHNRQAVNRVMELLHMETRHAG